MATYTPNYGLHQWVPEDNFLRTDFNEDFQKIDTALGQKAEAANTTSRLTALEGRVEVRIGSYTGDGAESRTISLGFTPKAVLLECDMGHRSDSYIRYGGLALNGKPVVGMSNHTALEIVSGGFIVYYYPGYSNTNAVNMDFYYLAFK